MSGDYRRCRPRNRCYLFFAYTQTPLLWPHNQNVDVTHSPNIIRYTRFVWQTVNTRLSCVIARIILLISTESGGRVFFGRSRLLELRWTSVNRLRSQNRHVTHDGTFRSVVDRVLLSPLSLLLLCHLPTDRCHVPLHTDIQGLQQAGGVRRQTAQFVEFGAWRNTQVCQKPRGTTVGCQSPTWIAQGKQPHSYQPWFLPRLFIYPHRSPTTKNINVDWLYVAFNARC